MRKRFFAWINKHSSRRSQHLVFLIHVWLFTPFLIAWLRDPRIQSVLGTDAVGNLRPVIWLVFLYLIGRTWLAWRDPPKLAWDFVFPPIDVAVITVILCLSQRGPMSNISLLYFLPIIEAAATLNVGWSAGVGLLVVAGTALSALFGMGAIPNVSNETLPELWQGNALNIVFRLYFIFVVSSLMTYQALIAAGVKQKLAVAADRNRIAADMHDGVQGHLITVASQLELLSHIIDHNPVRASELAADARESARKGADELRFLVHRMRASELEGGFLSGLRQYTHNMATRNGLDLSFQIVGMERPVDPDVENCIFRVAQEALTNVVKHAQASKVEILLTFEADSLRLVVQDDGIGLDEASDRLGHSMRDRLAKMEGRLELDNRGHGVQVVAVLPA
jgi:signal transduction histidine kinase